MTIQKIVKSHIDEAADQIYSACIIETRSHLSTYDHIRNVLNNLAIDTVESYCDTIKEKK